MTPTVVASIVRVASSSVLVLVLLATGEGWPMHARASPTPDAVAATCPVTLFAAQEPTFAYTPTWYGGGKLWAGLDRAYGGRWYAGPEALKVMWLRPTGEQLTVEGQRLDAGAPPLDAAIPTGYFAGYQVTGLTFPTEGCWEVTGRAGNEELRFVVDVHPAAANPATGATAAPAGPDTWAMLRRPLHLPELGLPADGSCPSTGPFAASPDFHIAGPGPVYPAGAAGDGLFAYGPGGTGDWKLVKGLWAANPSYTGPVLIRGGQLDGHDELRFFDEPGSPTIVTELHLDGQPDDTLVPLSDDAPFFPGWRYWGMTTLVRAPGCYAVQIDGWNFSEVVIVAARG